MSIRMTPELKECPFCGGKPEWNKGQLGDGSDWNYVACEKCEAIAPHPCTMEDWNTRDQARERELVISMKTLMEDVKVMATKYQHGVKPWSLDNATETLKRLGYGDEK